MWSCRKLNQNSWRLFLCSCRPIIPLVLLPVPSHQQLRSLLRSKKQVGVFAVIKYQYLFFLLWCLSFCLWFVILRPCGVFFLYLFCLIVFPIDHFEVIQYLRANFILNSVTDILVLPWFQSLRIFFCIFIIIFISSNFIHAFLSFFQSWGYITCYWVS